MGIFLKKLANIPLLTKEEEKTLFPLVREGDIAARNRVIVANTRLVLYVAKHFIAPDFTLDDGFCVGLVGLEKAVKNFKVEKGYRFSTFASKCIYRTLLDDLQDRQRKKRYEVSGFYDMVTRSGEVTADTNDAGYSKGGPDRRRAVPWFNAEWKANEENHLDPLKWKEDHTQILQALDSLDERGKDVIKARFGFPPYEETITLRELAKKYGVTKQCISLWENKAMATLRRNFKGALDHA